MRSQARAKVGNKRGSPGYRSPAPWRYKKVKKIQLAKSDFFKKI